MKERKINLDFNPQRFLDFKREISEIKDKQTKGELQSVDLVDSELGNFNVDDLTYEDMEIFEKVKNGTITPEDLENYRKKINKITKQRRLKGDKKLSSREIFCGFIINSAFPIFIEKSYLMKKFKKKS